MNYIMLNHRPVPAQEAKVSVQDRGFRYGDGVFETVAVAGGAPYRLDWHLRRLARGLETVRIDCRLVSLLSKECAELIAMNRVGDGLLRIQVTRGAGGRGYLPDASVEPTVVIETMPPPGLPAEPVSLWLGSWRRVPADALPVRSKLSQGMNSTLARMEAEENGCFDALQLNMNGEICETSSANIFWLSGNTLHTPSLDCGAVEGSMRAAILELAPYPVREVRAAPEALQEADAVCITNAAWKALAVGALQPAGLRWESEALARKLRDVLAADMQRRPVAKGA